MRLLFGSPKRGELIAPPIFYLKWSLVIALGPVRICLTSKALGKTCLAPGQVRLPITGDPHNRSFSDRVIHSATLSYRSRKSLIFFCHVLPAFLPAFYRHSSYHHIITFLCINVSERGTSRLLVWSIALCECLYIHCLLYSRSLLIHAPFYLIQWSGILA